MNKQLVCYLVSILIPLILDGCNDCKSGIYFIPAFRGTWKLVRVVSPSKTLQTVSYKEYLKINLVGDSWGNAITVEKLLRDSLSTDTALVAKNEWAAYTADCGSNSVLVTFNSHLQRKYSLGSGDQILEATGYVNHVGDKSDTTKYVYQLQQ